MASELKTLVESYKAHPEATATSLRNVCEQKKAFPDHRNWEIGEVFAECFGRDKYNQFKYERGTEGVGHFLRENSGAVTTQAFVNINKTFLFGAALESASYPQVEFAPQIPVVNSGTQKFLQLRGVSKLGRESKVVHEAEKFPQATIGENYVRTPDVTKRGFTVPITKEAIFFDQTGQVRQEAAKLMEAHEIDKEARAIAAVVDLGESEANGYYRYGWGKAQSGFARIATFGDSSGDHNWDNLSASTPLTDFASWKAVYNVLMAMRDPFTGLPMYIQPKHVILGTSLAFNLPFTLGGGLAQFTGGYPVTGNPVRTDGITNMAQTIIGNITPIGLKSNYFEYIAGTTTTWYVGDISKALVNVQAWPAEIKTNGPGSDDEFKRDIAMQYRVDECQTFAVVEPRALVKATA